MEVHRQSYKRRDLQTTQLDMERKCVFMTYLEGRSIIHVLVICIMYIYIYCIWSFLIMTCHELYLTSASKTSSQSSSPTSTVSRSLPTKITESSNHPIDSLQPRYGRSWIPPYQTHNAMGNEMDCRIHYTIPFPEHMSTVNACSCRRLGCRKAEKGDHRPQ